MFPLPRRGSGAALWGPGQSPAWRLDNLEPFLGLQAAPVVDFAGITFISVKFSRGSQPYKTPHNQILWRSGTPLDRRLCMNDLPEVLRSSA